MTHPAVSSQAAPATPMHSAQSLGGTTSPIRVLIADDQAMIRGALATFLDLEDSITVVAQAENGAVALEQLKVLAQQDTGHPVDVVLTDIEMPVMDGITATEAICARYPGVKVLVLTTFGRPGYVQRALAAGASGFIVKDAPVDELVQSIHRVHAGGRVIDEGLAVQALTAGTSPLTDREREVLHAAARGGTIADIADFVGLSQGTIRNHISAIMTKTGARTRAEAVSIARDSGWL